MSNNVYIARIDCAHLDVSYGLYKSLRNSVSLTPSILDDSSNYAFPVDSSLTNSEIAILTEYAESQVADAPQYITTSLWSWCYGNYNITKYTDKHGKVHNYRNNDVMVCQRGPSEYVFDYRQELELLGLGSILAYAFQTRKYDDANYAELVKARHLQYRLVTPLLIFGGATQLGIIVFTLVLYSNRGKEQDLTKVPEFLLHIMSVVNVFSFLGFAISSGVVTHLLRTIRTEIGKTLGDFGISLHLGRVWFALLWLGVSFGTLAMLSWVLPIWCANPPDDEYEYEYDESYNNDTFVNSSINRHSHNDGHRKRFSGARPAEEMEENLGVFGDEYGVSRNNSSRSKHLQPSRNDSRTNFFHDYIEQGISDDSDAESDKEMSRKSSKVRIHQEMYESQPKLEIDHFSTDFYHKDERELRKLGESLSKKPSVRHLYRKTKPTKVDTTDLLPVKEETRHLLYNEANLADAKYPTNRHYREETYDGYVNANNISRENSFKNNSRSRSNSNRNMTRSRSGTTTSKNYEPMIDDNVFTEGSSNDLQGMAHFTSETNLDHLQHNPKNNPFLSKRQNHQYRQSMNDSLLNEDEINLLDLNNFINNFK